ncbi:hypothetical protein LEP1GSC021_0570 [Leptospira noguchii str. 1993005606]|uniref:Uncharacterized protein n=2 Tax=Leptospira noguchii TaxID=28182 RepID=M6Y6Y6_9LEPT|nr:hypothetical protein LEP1GSC035_1160 [Leptospira noguchii str. 2007001578]EMO87611.1 hypothetical protein LEP1GSC024_3565 [Leptospira noguchii str. 2001034031]EPE82283.1 hypothetical protein LEP1GSC021_0570 [Leptospira noguchii str. 1993005606]
MENLFFNNSIYEFSFLSVDYLKNINTKLLIHDSRKISDFEI